MFTHKQTIYRLGFTLIELLVVIAIIGTLATIVIASVDGARSRARDVKRISDLQSIEVALQEYHSKYGTYLVAGTGWNGTGQGCIGDENVDAYTTAVTRGLYNEGFLPAPIVDDPVYPVTLGYMLYLCDNNQTYALSAAKENPTAQDIAYIQTTCNGTGSNGTYSVYHMNFALTNKTH